MEPVLILYASQTGTAEELAKDINSQLNEVGIPTVCNDVYDCKISALKQYTFCLLLASTWGEGEPPDDAEEFYNALEEAKELDLSQLRFAVFGLGDSGYDEFNECGKNFDRMLAERGGQRMLPRVDCDIDIDGPFEIWGNQIIEQLRALPA
ncbi:flavodoxin domain-containing protein [Verrucomicrobiaceae bacterium R5-34]|uniref:Flavodoxin domain-containing protein n=1 Tax=Oceaniferula flava TaxID=2800421 RepID=A0AAE2SA60_9BACT|nr:flavodoxin domain-containing protein [Oceaniferula flavus]MBK1830513.1 flavodoxin domain-containing protein [Verrucomicrobiaceae bacterium R5-34]MBK1854613.1 flavodoxin domain-containing protein [Oceaniferula flavus]MBM1135919.1 flavodoxin domain-containing protein [Oceaniferula flavus]